MIGKMETITEPVIDKSTWGDGPWQHEPDRVEFRHAGLPCLIRRNPGLGQLCGYAAVPPGHPLHGKSYEDVDAEVHGGLSYAQHCSGDVCHVAGPGEPDNVWWFGFDCGHCFDLAPGIVALQRSIEGGRPRIMDEMETYRDMAYMRQQTERLAEQLAALAHTSPVCQVSQPSPNTQHPPPG